MFSFVSLFIKRPQDVFLRKVIFQIHLWIGIAAAIYVALIGLSGAILVFKPELYRLNHPKPAIQKMAQGGSIIGAGDALRAALATQPGKFASLLLFPRPDEPYYIVVVGDRLHSKRIDVDPSTRKVLLIEDPNVGWLSVVTNLHYYLLLPPRRGLMLNGIGAVALLLLAISGIVLWWPGVRAWKRGVLIDFSLSFKRITRDSHSVVGLAALALISFWAFSGIYFAWTNQFVAAISAFSRATEPRTRLHVSSSRGKPMDLNALIPIAQKSLPGEMPLAVFMAGSRTTVLMGRKPDMAFGQSDGVALDGVRGTVLKTVRQSDPRSFGDRVLDLMEPLHFGTQWGLGMKIVYCLGGLAVSFLAVTGILMYWQRYLQKCWVLTRSPAAASPKREQVQTP